MHYPWPKGKYQDSQIPSILRNLALIGAAANDKTLASVAEAAATEADIIADMRGSASYKRELLRVYVARAVRAAVGGGA